VNTVKDFFF